MSLFVVDFSLLSSMNELGTGCIGLVFDLRDKTMKVPIEEKHYSMESHMTICSPLW